jgi:hypothetical protein
MTLAVQFNFPRQSFALFSRRLFMQTTAEFPSRGITGALSQEGAEVFAGMP